MLKNTFVFLTLVSLFVFFALVGLLVSCQETPEKKNNIKEVKKEIVLNPTPVFSGDSAYLFVKAQVDFGPRVPNTAAHQKCGDYLIESLKKFGCEVVVQKFDAVAYDKTVLKSRNIIASLNPKASRRIIIAAHWDTRPIADKDKKDTLKPIDGANDGGSGVAIILELARTISLSEKKPTVGIDFILFDSEDYGQPDYTSQQDYKPETWCLGSQYWSKNNPSKAYFGILLDMVGAKNAKFYMEGTSMKNASSINQRIWDIGNKLGFSNSFIYKGSPEITDDHVYMNKAGIPTIDIIEYDPSQGNSFFGSYHHTLQDNMDIIDKETLKAVGQTVLQVIYNGEDSL